MGGNQDKTPTQRPTAVCPFCRKKQRITIAGLFELHTVTGMWNKSMCRGSGAKARSSTIRREK